MCNGVQPVPQGVPGHDVADRSPAAAAAPEEDGPGRGGAGTAAVGHVRVRVRQRQHPGPGWVQLCAVRLGSGPRHASLHVPVDGELLFSAVVGCGWNLKPN